MTLLQPSRDIDDADHPTASPRGAQDARPHDKGNGRRTPPGGQPTAFAALTRDNTADRGAPATGRENAPRAGAGAHAETVTPLTLAAAAAGTATGGSRPMSATAAAAASFLGGGRVGQHVRVPKTAELVAAHLRRQIVRGELTEGDALPPEAVLMEQFGVSRPTLREAFRVLESEALISVRRGAHGGARVHTPNGHVAARYTALVLEHRHTTLADIHTAHTHLEPTAIRLLATTATDTTLTTLTTHLTTTDHHLTHPNPDPHLIHTHHLTFHTLLLDTTGNHTLTMITSMLRHILDATTPDTPTPTLDTLHHQHTLHHQLLTHLTHHDPDAAETLWRHHLTHTPHTPHHPTTPLDLLDLLGTAG